MMSIAILIFTSTFVVSLNFFKYVVALQFSNVNTLDVTRLNSNQFVETEDIMGI